MTDATPTTPTTPTPSDGGASPKKSPWRFLGPIIAVVVVLGVIVYQVVLPMIEDAKYKVGACLNDIPTSTVSETLKEKPNVVDCADPSAKSQITAVLEGKSIDDAQQSCPDGFVAAIELPANSFVTKQKLLCLTEP